MYSRSVLFRNIFFQNNRRMSTLSYPLPSDFRPWPLFQPRFVKEALQAARDAKQREAKFTAFMQKYPELPSIDIENTFYFFPISRPLSHTLRSGIHPEPVMQNLLCLYR